MTKISCDFCSSVRALIDKETTVEGYRGTAAESKWFRVMDCYSEFLRDPRTHRLREKEKRFYCSPLCYVNALTQQHVTPSKALLTNFREWFATQEGRFHDVEVRTEELVNSFYTEEPVVVNE